MGNAPTPSEYPKVRRNHFKVVTRFAPVFMLTPNAMVVTPDTAQLEGDHASTGGGEAGFDF